MLPAPASCFVPMPTTARHSARPSRSDLTFPLPSATKKNAADRGSAAPSSGRSSGGLTLSLTLSRVLGELRPDQRIGIGADVLALTYTLVAVEAAMALDREAMTMAVAIASLLNMGGLPLLASRCGSHSHVHEFAAASQRLHVGLLGPGLLGSVTWRGMEAAASWPREHACNFLKRHREHSSQA